MKHALEFLMQGAAVSRYHTVDLIKSETVGHHSHGVAMLCFLIEPNASRQLLEAALLHDLAEQSVGDIPSPVKRDLSIRKELHKLEEDALEAAGLKMPSLSSHEEKVLKLADMFHGALKCAREINMGNVALRVVFDRYVEYSEEVGLVTAEAVEIHSTIKGMVK